MSGFFKALSSMGKSSKAVSKQPPSAALSSSTRVRQASTTASAGTAAAKAAPTVSKARSVRGLAAGGAAAVTVAAGTLYLTGALNEACEQVHGEDAQACKWLDAPRNALANALGISSDAAMALMYVLGFVATTAAVVGTYRGQEVLLGPLRDTLGPNEKMPLFFQNPRNIAPGIAGAVTAATALTMIHGSGL